MVTLTLGKLHLQPGTSQSFSSLSGSAALALGANTLTVGGDNTSTTYSGVLSDGGSAHPRRFDKDRNRDFNSRRGQHLCRNDNDNQGAISITADSGLGRLPPPLVANQLTLNGLAGAAQLYTRLRRDSDLQRESRNYP